MECESVFHTPINPDEAGKGARGRSLDMLTAGPYQEAYKIHLREYYWSFDSDKHLPGKKGVALSKLEFYRLFEELPEALRQTLRGDASFKTYVEELTAQVLKMPGLVPEKVCELIYEAMQTPEDHERVRRAGGKTPRKDMHTNSCNDVKDAVLAALARNTVQVRLESLVPSAETPMPSPPEDFFPESQVLDL